MKESMLVDSRSNDEEKREAEKKQRVRFIIGTDPSFANETH